jgi:hypothetical protein
MPAKENLEKILFVNAMRTLSVLLRQSMQIVLNHHLFLHDPLLPHAMDPHRSEE